MGSLQWFGVVNGHEALVLLIPNCCVQICAAYRGVGGKTVAVLSCRPKLEMEELFDATIPKSRRYKTRFVFRQVLEPFLLFTPLLWAG